MLVETRSQPAVRVREIADGDIGAMAELLGQGLGYPPTAYLEVFGLLRDHPTPNGFPKYGYLLEANNSIVGGIILIFSSLPSHEGRTIRCHVTGWFVEPAYRTYASLFVLKALKHKDVTYINVSARPATVPIIEAQGFMKYSKGQFAAIPLLNIFSSRWNDGAVVNTGAAREGQFEPYERDLLLAHERYGCICFWCVTPERAYPFVFQSRFVKGVIPGVQLIYCRDIGDLARFARPIGLHLASRGKFVICMDASGPVQNLRGKYFDGVQPRYYKGTKPRLGDLAYTLPALYPPYFSRVRPGRSISGATD